MPGIFIWTCSKLIIKTQTKRHFKVSLIILIDNFEQIELNIPFII